MATYSSLKFTVRRREPELVAPAQPTPRELKPLSDIDDSDSLRFQIPILFIYRHQPSMAGLDPVTIIRDALAKALVFYYPFAGRLIEGPNRKLIVDCTGEGVLFIEADADVSVSQFGDNLRPPFPCMDDLLYDAPGSAGILHCPLLLFQVTRLRCGSFILAIRLNHTMSDGIGLTQFMKTVADIARGARVPSILPIWQRELLRARSPPRPTCTIREYEQIEDDKKATATPIEDMIRRSFAFGSNEINTLRSQLPPHLQRTCTTFELLAAFVWRCRTIALEPKPNEEVRLNVLVEARSKLSTPLPEGYYGNVFVIPQAITTGEQLCKKPLGYAVELIRNAKRQVTEEYVKSVADLMEIKGRPTFTTVRTAFVISDNRRLGLLDLDFGWGTAAYGGVASGWAGPLPGVITFLVSYKNQKGEKLILVPIGLVAPAMKTFEKELGKMLNDGNRLLAYNQPPRLTSSL